MNESKQGFDPMLNVGILHWHTTQVENLVDSVDLLVIQGREHYREVSMFG